MFPIPSLHMLTTVNNDSDDLCLFSLDETIVSLRVVLMAVWLTVGALVPMHRCVLMNTCWMNKYLYSQITFPFL